MKKPIALAALLAATLGTAAPALAEPMVCLSTNWIKSTQFIGPKTILFHMKNGQVWRNTLRTACPGLKFSGFAYQVSFPEICGNVQTIYVLNSGEACALGRFTPEKPDKT